jgi:hypothetical protein
MSCEHLVCANCAGPVDEGRCPTCRAAHASLHSHNRGGLTPQTLLIIASLTVLLVMLISRVHG